MQKDVGSGSHHPAREEEKYVLVVMGDRQI